MGALTLPSSLPSSLSSALSWAHEVTSGAAPRRSRCPQLVLLSCSRLGCQLLHTSLKITNAFLSHLCIFSPHIFYICFPSFAYFFQASILDPSTSSPLLLIPLSLLLPVFLLLALAPLLWQAEHPRVENLTKFTLNKQTSLFYKNNLNMFQGICWWSLKKFYQIIWHLLPTWKWRASH